MDLKTKLKGLLAVGIGNLFQSAAYAWKRDRVDGKFLPPAEPGPERLPGGIHSFSALGGGLTVNFENAQLEVRFLAPDFVRVTWTPGELPYPYTIARTQWPVVKTDYAPTDDGWQLQSSAVKVGVAATGELTFSRADGSLLRRDEAPVRAGSRWRLRSTLAEEEHLYGLGERTRRLNLRGHAWRNWNREPMGAYTEGDDPLYVCVPVVLSLQERGSSLAYFENSFESTFDFRQDAVMEFADGALRYYVALGTPASCLERYTELTGRPALPPRWALGYHQARWSYMDEGEVRDLVRGFEEHELPLSAVHLDIHYMDGYRVFTVDKGRFADLGALTAELGRQGIRTVTILDPGIKTDPGYDVFARGVEQETFCRQPDGELATGPVWPGNCAFPDFTKPAARRWWGELYQRVADWGVAGVWHDMNEVAVFAAWGEPTLPRSTRHDFDGRGGDHREGHNLYALLEARAGFEGLRKAAPHRRPWILSRSGWAGLQRHAWTWTGDCESDWWTLGQSVRIAVAMGLSGIPYNGPDIGGFGGSPSAELFTRWFQAAAFLPFFRTHCAVFAPRREPWVFGEPTLSVVREFLRMRYRLMPALYTLAWQAHRSGAPLVRPLFWEWPERAELWDVEDQFLLGPSLLVAPVLEAGAKHRSVVLPPGEWVDFWTDECHQGPGTVTVETPLERIPLFVRAGAVLPMEEEGRTCLHLFPPTREGTGEVPPGGALFVDSGDGDGPRRYETFEVSSVPGLLRLRREVRDDTGVAEPALTLSVHGEAPTSVTVEGKEVPSLQRFTLPVGREVVMRWQGSGTE
jgi:alpha-glucosidase